MKKTIILILLGVIGYFLEYFFNTFVAQHLTTAEYGDFSVGLKMFLLFSTLLLLGINVSAKRFLAKYLGDSNLDLSRKYINWSTKVTLFLSLFFLIGLAIVAIVFYLLNFSYGHRLEIYIIFASPIMAIFLLHTTYILCDKHYYISRSLASIVQWGIFIAAFFVAITFWDLKKNMFILPATFVMTSLILVFISFSFCKYLFPTKLAVDDIANVLHTHILDQKKWLRSALKLSFSHSFYLFNVYIDLFIVEIFAKNESHVGLYAASLVISSSIIIIPNFAYVHIKPMISRATTAESKEKLKKAIAKANIIKFILISLVAAGIIKFRAFLLGLYGSEYTQAGDVLILLTIQQLIFSVSKPAASLLAIGGYENISLTVNVIVLLLSLILITAMTILFGIIGAAVGTIIASSVDSFLLVLLCYKKTHIKSAILF